MFSVLLYCHFWFGGRKEIQPVEHTLNYYSCTSLCSEGTRRQGNPTTWPTLGMLIFPNLGEVVPLWWFT